MTTPEDPNKSPEESQPKDEGAPTNESFGETAPKEPAKEQNYEELKPCTSEQTDEDRQKIFEEALVFLMDHPERVNEAIRNMKRNNLPGSEQDNERYATFAGEAERHHPKPQFDGDVSPFFRESSFWRQSVQHNNEEISAARPVFSNKGGKLSGDSALLRVRAAAGLGTIVNVPLWHTGIWLKVKAPSEGTLLELDRRIGMEKISLGRRTVGVAFSNASIYLTSYLLDMILNHVYDGTYKDLSISALKKVIKVTDIPQLVWGMACAIWPNGYRLVRPCVNDPLECNHLDEAHVNLSKLSWVDNRAISTSQRNHMAHRDGTSTDEQLIAYRDAHVAPQKTSVKITDDMTLQLEVPTISQYEDAGFRWVDGVVRMADEAFGQSLRGQERNDYIAQRGAMANLRRYSHWVSSIVFSDGAIAEDRESIDQALDSLTGSEEFRKVILDGTNDFIRKSVINAIGIPQYTCPSCGKGPNSEDTVERLPEIIQLEVNEVFFTLQRMRVLKIMASD
jgi:hypothetical protein